MVWEARCTRAREPEGCATPEVPAEASCLMCCALARWPVPQFPALHALGEALDVVGRMGGCNFLWAWVSGRRVGESAALA